MRLNFDASDLGWDEKDWHRRLLEDRQQEELERLEMELPASRREKPQKKPNRLRLGAKTVEAAKREAYKSEFRPQMWQVLNPRYRRHPDWPEEWWVRVPGTLISWDARDQERFVLPHPQRLRVESYPSESNAAKAAESHWRSAWMANSPAEAAPFFEENSRAPEVARIFLVDHRYLEDSRALEDWLEAHPGVWPEEVLIHHRNAHNVITTKAIASAEAGQEWLEGMAEAIGEDPYAQAVTAAEALDAARAAHALGAAPSQTSPDLSVWRVSSWDPAATDNTYIVWRANPEAPKDAKLARYTFLVNASGAPFRIHAASLEAAQRALPFAVEGDAQPPDDLMAAWLQVAAQDSVPTPRVDEWLKTGRLLLLTSRAIGMSHPETRDTAQRLWDATTSAVEQILPPSHILPDSSKPLQEAQKQIHTAAQALYAVEPSSVLRLARQFNEQGLQLLADEALCFAHGRLSPNQLLDPMLSDGESLAYTDPAEWYATRLPSGQFLVAQQMGKTFLRVEDQPLADPATVQVFVHEQGGVLTFQQDAKIIDQWKAGVERRHPEQAETLIAHAETPPAPAPRRPTISVDEAAERILATLRVEQAIRATETLERPTVYLSPLGTGLVVPWAISHIDANHKKHKDPMMRFLKHPPDAGELDLYESSLPGLQAMRNRAYQAGEPIPVTGKPWLLESESEGFSHQLAALQTQHPEIQWEPRMLPPRLVKDLADTWDVLPRPLEHTRDALWLVNAPNGPKEPVALAWTYQYHAERKPDTDWKKEKPEVAYAVTQRVVPLWNATPTELPSGEKRQFPVVFHGESQGAAITTAHARFQEAGLVSTSDPALPAELLDPFYEAQQTRSVRRGVRPPEPFEFYTKLSPKRQAAIQEGLQAPDDLRNLLAAVAYGLKPRDMAGFLGKHVDAVVNQYRQLERKLGDYLIENPHLRPGPADPVITVGKAAPAVHLSDDSRHQLAKQARALRPTLS